VFKIDFPASCAWKELYDKYPNAKVVLTTPYPHLHDAKSLQRRFAGIRWGTRLRPYLLLAAVAAAPGRRA